MAAGFPEAEVRRWGRFAGDPTPEQLVRFFTFGPDDIERIRRRRSPAMRLGYGVQLGTVRFLGIFTDLNGIPTSVVRHVAADLDIDPAAWSDYTTARGRLVHQQEIREDGGYHLFGTGVTHVAFLRWLWGRAWSGNDPPSVLVDLATGWLVDHRVLLPGFSVLQRLCARARDRATRRGWRTVAAQLSPDQQRRLERLVMVDPTGTVSDLERMRRQPRNPTIEGLCAALTRLEEVQGLGGQRLDLTGVPAGRIDRLVTEANHVKAQRIARHPPMQRQAVLAAFSHRLHASAHDDVIDVLLLVLRELVNRIERLSDKERLRSLGDLDAAAATLAAAARVLLDSSVADPAVRSQVFAQLTPATLEQAVATVDRVITTPGERLASGLKSRYPHVRRFLPDLLRLVTFDATTKTNPVLAAVRHLAAMEKGDATIDQAPTAVVTTAWRTLVHPRPGVTDKRAWTLCVLEQLRLAIGRRDVFVPAASRWGDPRRLLLDNTSWRQSAPHVLRALDLTGGARRLLSRLGDELDDAYRRAATVVADNPSLLAVARDRERFKVPPLDALDLPPSTEALRGLVTNLIPSAELPEVLLEVNGWCPFTDAFTHTTGGRGRVPDLALSICAALLVEACNVPYSAVARADIPALTESRLKWVEANYLRPETITAANNRLIDYQATIGIVRHWGGGELTSADGMRFVVPVRSVHAGANPRYFGTGRGLTLFNYLTDNYLGWP